MSDFSWSYAINQFIPHQIDRFVRRDDHERAFKVLSALGYHSIELQAGTTRWAPLGRPELIAASYGSLDGFRIALSDCGLDGVSSISWNPSTPAEEEGWRPFSTRRPDDHAALVAAGRPFVDALAELGGDVLVVTATEPFDRSGPLTDEDITTVARALNALGEHARPQGVTIAVDVDALSAFRTAEQIHTLLERTDPEAVGLSIDTGEVTIALHDARRLVNEFAPRLRHVQLKDVVATDELGEYALPGADRALLLEGGARGIERWYHELGVDGGRVDLPGIVADLRANGYGGWVTVETQHGPAPVEIAMINSWYIRTHLDADFRRRRTDNIEREGALHA